MLLPALLAGSATGRITDYLGMVVGLIAIHLGTRARAEAGTTYGARVLNATLLVTALSGVVGAAGYALFGMWRPGLLAARFALYQTQVRASGAAADRIAQELARLAATEAQYLDPFFQAFTIAGNLFIVGMLLGAYGAWQFEVGRRWRRPRGAPTG